MKYVYIAVAIIFISLGFVYLYFSDEVALTKECSVCLCYQNTQVSQDFILLKPKTPLVEGHVILLPKNHKSEMEHFTDEEKSFLLSQLNSIDWFYFKNYAVIGHRYFVSRTLSGHVFIDVVPKVSLLDHIYIFIKKQYRCFSLSKDLFLENLDSLVLET